MRCPCGLPLLLGPLVPHSPSKTGVNALVESGDPVLWPSAPRPDSRFRGNERRMRRGLEIPLPGLADQIDAERVMRLFGDELEARARIDRTRRGQNALGPQ